MALIHSATEIYNALLEKISNEVREASGDDEALLKIIEKYNIDQRIKLAEMTDILIF